MTLRNVRPAVECLEDRTLLNAYFWTGAAGNKSWADKTNWFDIDNQQVATRAPGTDKKVADVVTFDLNRAQNRSATVDISLYPLEKVEIDDNYPTATLMLDNDLTTKSLFFLSPRVTIDGPRNLILTSGESVWAAGTMRGTGRTIVGPNATLKVSKNAEVTLSVRLLRNEGTLELEDLSTLNMLNGAVIYNAVTQPKGFVEPKPGRIDMQGEATIVSPEGTDGLIVNVGQFLSGPGSVTIIAVTFDNYGTVQTRNAMDTDGTLIFQGGGGGVGGIYDNAPRATMIFTGVAGVAGEPAPTYLWGNEQLTGALDGAFILRGARAEVMQGSKVEVRGVFILEKNGELGGSGDFEVKLRSKFLWQDGKMTGTGKTILQSSFSTPPALMRIGNVDGAPTIAMEQRTIENFGEIDILGAGTIALSEGAKIINKTTFKGEIGPKSLIDFMDDSSISGDNTTSVINQPRGLIEKSEGAGTSRITAPVENMGVLVIFSGTLKIPNLTQKQKQALQAATSENGGKLDTDGLFQLQGGVVQGISASQMTAEIIGDVLNTGGIMEPGGADETGIIKIDGTNGTYTQIDQGVLDVDLRDASASGAGYDQLQITGQITLGGFLHVNALSGFTGNRFVIIDNQSGLGVNGYFTGLPDRAYASLLLQDTVTTQDFFEEIGIQGCRVSFLGDAQLGRVRLQERQGQAA